VNADGPLWQRRVTYASVGGTKAEDLLGYPPRGYRSVVRRARIGHGDARFQHAGTAVLNWAVQRNSGFTVELEESPAEVTDGTYVAVGFNAKGVPVVPAGGDRIAGSTGLDGTPLLKPGDSATLHLPLGPVTVSAPVRVIYVVDDPACRGFAYGTLPGHPERGEEAFLVEQEQDGSVWLTVKAFSRPANLGWWLLAPVIMVVQARMTARYLRSLSGPVPKVNGSLAEIDAERAAAG
jgi:uncharacterized protein (UPF0548 family)